MSRGPWAGSLIFTGLRGQALYRVVLDASDPRRAVSVEPLFSGQFGRLRDIVEGPDVGLFFLTSNRDRRGAPATDDDRLIRLNVR